MGLELDPVLRLALRLLLAVLMLIAALHKARDLTAFRAALAGYAIVPARLVSGAALVLVALEVGAAALLVAPAPAWGPLVSAALLLVYTTAIGFNLWRGRTEIDCGCSFGRRGSTLGWSLVARNGVLIGAAVGAAGVPATRPLVWMDGVTAVAGAASLFLLYYAADTLRANWVLSASVQESARG